MDKECKVFSGGFNKILDLISVEENEVSDKFERFVKLIPQNIKNEISQCCDFEFCDDDFEVSVVRLVNAIDFDFIKLKPYLRFNVYVHRLFEDDLLPKKLFSLSVKNMRPNYAKNDLNEQDLSLNTLWEVYLDCNEFGPFLEYRKTFRGDEVYSRKKQISFYQLENCLETEEEYEDDWEIEFDADFEV